MPNILITTIGGTWEIVPYDVPSKGRHPAGG